MKNKTLIFGSLIIVIALIPSLFFPLASDHALFILAGKTINNGGDIYKDFIDLKPPLIYYVYAFIGKIFGESEASIRLFDFLIQSISLLFLARFIKLKSANDLLAILPGIIYSFTYTALHFNQTFQAESFATPVFVALLYLQFSDKRSIIKLVTRGLLISFLIGLKLTMGIFLFALIFDDLSRKKMTFQTSLKDASITILGMVLGLILIAMPLIINGTLPYFSDTMNYLSMYAAMTKIDSTYLTWAIKKLTEVLGYNISITIIGLALYAIIRNFINKDKDQIAYFSIVMSIFLFISIAVEKKFHIYHFNRMLVPLAILAGITIVEIIQNLKNRDTKFDIYQKAILVFMILIALLLSPLPRWINLARLPLYSMTNEVKYNNFFTRDGSSELLRNEHFKAAATVKKDAKEHDKVFVIATGACQLTYQLREFQYSKFSQSCFYFAGSTLEKWKSEFIEELGESDWLIIQKNDYHLHINGHQRSSWESINHSRIFEQNILPYFKEINDTGNFIIFKRK